MAYGDKCWKCKTDINLIEFRYDTGLKWNNQTETGVLESNKWCINCIVWTSKRINENNNKLNNQINNLRDSTNHKSEELQALIQSLSLRIDENQAIYDSKTEEFEQTIEDKFEQLDETISDFMAGAQRFNQAKLESLLAEKEAVLNLEILKKR